MQRRYYAVDIGHRPGVYESIRDAQNTMRGFPYAHMKRFDNYDAAQAFVSRPQAQRTQARQLAITSGGNNQQSDEKPKPSTSAAKPDHGNDLKREMYLAQIAKLQSLSQDAQVRHEQAKSGLHSSESEIERLKQLLENAEAQREKAKQEVQDSKGRLKECMSQLNDLAEEYATFKDKLHPNDKRLCYVYMNNVYSSLYSAKKAANGDPVYKCWNQHHVSLALRAKGFKDGDRVDVTHRLFVNTDNNGKSTYYVYTDGACRGNGNVGASAGIGVYFGPQNDLNVAERLDGSRQTNQRAELAAVLKAYQLIEKYEDGKTYVICSDSAYVVAALNKQIPIYQSNGWRNIKGEPVANQDLLQVLAEYQKRHPEISIMKVQGHNGNFSNDEADRLAKEGVDASGSKPNYCCCAFCVRSPFADTVGL